MKKTASHKLIEALKNKDPQALLRRSTWAALLERPEQSLRRMRGRFGSTSRLPDGSDSWNLGPMEDWPDLPAQGLVGTSPVFRYWLLPLWIVTRGPNDQSRIGTEGNVPILRNKLFTTSHTQVPCLVAWLTSQGEWADDSAPRWEAVEETEINSDLPAEGTSGPVVVFRLAAEQLIVRQPREYALL